MLKQIFINVNLVFIQIAMKNKSILFKWKILSIKKFIEISFLIIKIMKINI